MNEKNVMLVEFRHRCELLRAKLVRCETQQFRVDEIQHCKYILRVKCFENDINRKQFFATSDTDFIRNVNPEMKSV